MTRLLPIEEIEGIGPAYGKRLRAGGIVHLGGLRYNDSRDIAELAEVSLERAQKWKGQAWFIALGMSSHVAELIVESGHALTLRDMTDVSIRRIVLAIEQDQDDTIALPKRIPEDQRIDINNEVVREWKRKALLAVNFSPALPIPKNVTLEQASLSRAIDRSVRRALGNDIPGVGSAEYVEICNKFVSRCREALFEPPTEEDRKRVERERNELLNFVSDQLLKHLDLWPANPWLRSLAFKSAVDKIDCTLPDPEGFENDLFRGISKLQIRVLFISQLRRKIWAQSLYALFDLADDIREALCDPGMLALGFKEKEKSKAFSGQGVKIGLVGDSWDINHPSFEGATLTPYKSKLTATEFSPDSAWVGLDTAVLSQMAATPLTKPKKVAKPPIGPYGIAPSAHFVLFGRKSEDVSLSQLIKSTTKFLGRGDVLLVPRTCVGLVQGPDINRMVDFPLSANPETHDALLSVAEKGVVVIIPGGIGKNNLKKLPFENLLKEPKDSTSDGYHSISGPVARPGIDKRLVECEKNGILVVGAQSSWSNKGPGIVRIPDIAFTVAGGNQRVVAGAGFTTGWHGPHATAATAAGLISLLIESSSLQGKTVKDKVIRKFLQKYTVPRWAKENIPERLTTQGRLHETITYMVGLVTENVPVVGERAKHRLSAIKLLEKYNNPKEKEDE